MADFFGDEQETIEIDPNKDYFAEYVGEGKKFKDERELARAKAEADAHIARVEAENAKFRDEMQQSKTIQDFMDQMKSQSSNRQEPGNHPGENETGNAGTSVSPEDLDKLINEKLTERQKVERSQTNQTWVMQQLQAKFGREYGQRVSAAAAELGMSKEEMTLLASEKPKAFLRLVDDHQPSAPQQGNFSPPNSRVNTQVDNSQSGVRKYAYYRNLRKQDPRLYQSARVQAEMHHNAYKQGAAFFE